MTWSFPEWATTDLRRGLTDELEDRPAKVALLIVVGGALAILNLGGLLTMMASAWQVAAGLGTAAARGAAPSVNTYVAAAALLLSALGMWWWADRRLSP